MSGSEHARPVWLTEMQAASTDDAIYAQWKAAPADPAEAVRAAFQYLYPEMPMESEVRAVLRALGHPTIEGDAS